VDWHDREENGLQSDHSDGVAHGSCLISGYWGAENLWSAFLERRMHERCASMQPKSEIVTPRTKIVRGLVENYGVGVAEVARQVGISTSGDSKILTRTLSN